jgi:peptidoglycan/xylan/chitin deacetylase (PgdA/CDA1 family)
MRPQAKAACGRLLFSARIDALLLRSTGVIVAFHRVHDAEDDTGLSVTRDMFERYCRFFKRHFRVVPLADLVTKLERGDRIDRHLSITFDDGYRDNFVNARPVLEALSLPATFFVVSGWIGSDVWPWWDRQRGARHAWMTWDEVRELRERGFDIGAHTRTHADLGRIGGTEAVEEISGARREIEEQIGGPVDLFAYPYGGRGNLAESNRALVRAAGFRCCCSCYGGLTPARANPFHLGRTPISDWYRSPHQFGFELARAAARRAGPAEQRCCEMSEAIGY